MHTQVSVIHYSLRYFICDPRSSVVPSLCALCAHTCSFTCIKNRHFFPKNKPFAVFKVLSPVCFFIYLWDLCYMMNKKCLSVDFMKPLKHQHIFGGLLQLTADCLFLLYSWVCVHGLCVRVDHGKMRKHMNIHHATHTPCNILTDMFTHTHSEAFDKPDCGVY